MSTWALPTLSTGSLTRSEMQGQAAGGKRVEGTEFHAQEATSPYILLLRCPEPPHVASSHGALMKAALPIGVLMRPQLTFRPLWEVILGRDLPGTLRTQHESCLVP